MLVTSMDQNQLTEIETAAQIHYTTGNIRDERVQAVLCQFDTPECFPRCRYILENSSSPYAQVFAASTMSELFGKQFTSIPMQDRIQLRDFLVQFLWNHTQLPPFVISQLTQLLGKVNKLGWFDKVNSEFIFRDTHTQLAKFLEGTSEQMLVGIKALTDLVGQVDEQGAIRSFTLQRKICTSFRDNALLTLFELSVQILRAFTNKTNPAFMSEAVITATLQLSLKCLTFDFIGTCPEDSGEDSYSVEVPSSWRGVINEQVLQLFFELYASLYSHGTKVLECIVQFGSIRRTFFGKDDRKLYFESILNMVTIVLQNGMGLRDGNNFHQFCRLLVRIKLHDLASILDGESYPKLIDLLGKFTLDSLAQNIPHTSVDYLLILWAKIVSCSTSKAKANNRIDVIAPKIATTYVQAKLKAVELGNEDDNLLDNQEQLLDQLERFSIIARCQYEDIWRGLSDIFTTLAANYQNAISSQNTQFMDTLEGQLSWLVYIIASVLGARTGCASISNYEAMDGEQVCKVLTLISLVDNSPGRGCESLEMAFLTFFKNFSKAYIGTHVLKSSRVFALLAEHVRLPDQLSVLDVFVQKLVTNFKNWVHSEAVIKETLKTLNELSLGYSYVRMLTKLDSVLFLLRNHNDPSIAFLNVPNYLKYRTTYYCSLSRLLFVSHENPLPGSPDAVERFMVPFDQTFQELSNIFGNSDPEQLKTNAELKYTVIGMARSLRGLVIAAHNKEMYMLIFDYIFPNYTNVLQMAVNIWHADFSVTTPILKFFGEFVDNKKKRVEFDISSANGILLFRQVSELLSTYASRMLRTDAPPGVDVVKQRYYGTRHSLMILMYALSGRYINFGVFKLYGDDALDKALNVFHMIITSVSFSDIMIYPKLARAYFSLVEVIVQDHMTFFAALDSSSFQYIMESLFQGLSSNGSSGPDNDIAVKSCVAMDTIISFHLKAIQKNPNQPSLLSYSLESCNNLLPECLTVMFQSVMFDDCPIYWNLSRPMLSLILLNNQCYNDVKQNLIMAQSTERQPLFQERFEGLMLEVDSTLTQRNRNQFTKNLNLFRRDVTNFTKTAPAEVAEPTASMNEDM